jgi:hypothetical protein
MDKNGNEWIRMDSVVHNNGYGWIRTDLKLYRLKNGYIYICA